MTLIVFLDNKHVFPTYDQVKLATKRCRLINITPAPDDSMKKMPWKNYLRNNLYSSSLPSNDFVGKSLATWWRVTLLAQGNIFNVFFTSIKKTMSLIFEIKNIHLWHPIAVMLHARPAFHKLTERKFQMGIGRDHLKKVVEPPEPYSSTSMSGLNTEQISSTPHQSNITVLISELTTADDHPVGHLPMVDSKESVRLYSYKHFSFTVIFPSWPPSKLPVNLSTPDLFQKYKNTLTITQI